MDKFKSSQIIYFLWMSWLKWHFSVVMYCKYTSKSPPTPIVRVLDICLCTKSWIWFRNTCSNCSKPSWKIHRISFRIHETIFSEYHKFPSFKFNHFYTQSHPWLVPNLLILAAPLPQIIQFFFMPPTSCTCWSVKLVCDYKQCTLSKDFYVGNWMWFSKG